MIALFFRLHFLAGGELPLAARHLGDVGGEVGAGAEDGQFRGLDTPFD